MFDVKGRNVVEMHSEGVMDGYAESTLVRFVSSLPITKVHALH
jgi:hypothetical protein